MPNDQQYNEYSVQIEREKTKRIYARLGVGGLLAALVIVFFFLNVRDGSLKITPDGIEVTVDEPLIDQVATEQQQIAVNGDTVAMTVGSVPDSVVQQIEQQQDSPLPSDRFVGRNLIDRTGGYVLSSATPASWKVLTPAATSEHRALLNLQTPTGSTVRVDTISSARCQDLDCVVRLVAKSAAERVRVTRDDQTSTAVIQYTDAEQHTVIVKVVRQNEHWYTAKGTIASDASAAERKDVIKTVTTFSLIAKK